MLLGKKALYIYKRNDKNNYLYLRNSFILVEKLLIQMKIKKRYGTFFISNKIPNKNENCSDYSTNYTTCLLE